MSKKKAVLFVCSRNVCQSRMVSKLILSAFVNISLGVHASCTYQINKMLQPSPSLCLSIYIFLSINLTLKQRISKGFPLQLYSLSVSMQQLWLTVLSKYLGRLCCHTIYFRIKIYIHTLPLIKFKLLSYWQQCIVSCSTTPFK